MISHSLVADQAPGRLATPRRLESIAQLVGHGLLHVTLLNNASDLSDYQLSPVIYSTVAEQLSTTTSQKWDWKSVILLELKYRSTTHTH